MPKIKSDQEIIEKMNLAYKNFSIYMNKLKEQAKILIRKKIKQEEDNKIDDIRKKIKNI